MVLAAHVVAWVGVGPNLGGKSCPNHTTERWNDVSNLVLNAYNTKSDNLHKVQPNTVATKTMWPLNDGFHPGEWKMALIIQRLGWLMLKIHSCPGRFKH